MKTSSPPHVMESSSATPHQTLSGWNERFGSLVRSFVFTDAAHALAFVVAASLKAEAARHHPEITLNWRMVSLRLTTHDAGNTVTAKDFALAAALDELARIYPQKH